MGLKSCLQFQLTKDTIMEKLFNAIRDQHLDYEIADLRLGVSQYEADDFDSNKLDDKLAEAVSNAKYIDLTNL